MNVHKAAPVLWGPRPFLSLCLGSIHGRFRGIPPPVPSPSKIRPSCLKYIPPASESEAGLQPTTAWLQHHDGSFRLVLAGSVTMAWILPGSHDNTGEVV